MKVVTISSWLNFVHPATPRRGSVAGRKFLAPPYYSHHTVFASLRALFPFIFYSSCYLFSSLTLLTGRTSGLQSTTVLQRNGIQIHSTALYWLKQLISPKLNSLLYFACRRKDVHLCFIMSLGKMIFAVLELWLSPLQWVLNYRIKFLTFLFAVLLQCHLWDRLK